MKTILALLALFIGSIDAPTARATETTLTDSDGQSAWLYTPAERPDPAKTYWLVVGVHGVGANGKGACGAAYLAKEFDDVIVLGPTFVQAKRDSATPASAGMPRDSFQMSGPAHEAKLHALIAEIAKTWKLHPRIVVHGFSAGAQFAHRYAMRNPERVAGVSAHSAGSWAQLEGDDRINPAAKGILFAISCGEDDKATGGPAGTPPRIDGARQFAANLESRGFSVEFKTWPGIGHAFAPGVMPMTKALLEKVRGTSVQPAAGKVFAGNADSGTRLPDDWDGVWRGEIEVLAGGAVQHRSKMELRVEKLEAPGAKSWTIRYSGQPPRDYEIRSVPGGKGRFVTDEKNGTVLDEQLIGSTLHSVFSLGDVLLTSRFENRGEEIAIEIATFAFSATRDGAPPPPTRAIPYPFRSIQRGVLRREKAQSSAPATTHERGGEKR